jgi:hypothetical protein
MAEEPEEQDADRLYGLPLGQFTAARDATARRLRLAKLRDEAAAVKALRKPTAAAWVVNQLVRRSDRALADLLGAADRLRAATEGGDAAALREAASAQRDAIDLLMAEAREIAAGGDVAEGALDRVRETLHAAAADDDARAQVTSGRLERELQAVGFGAFPLTMAPPAAPRAKPAAAPKPAPAAAAERKEERGPSAAERRRTEAARERARKEHARRGEAAADADEALAEAREALASARELLAGAEEAVARAEEDAQAARAAEREAAERVQALEAGEA